MMKRRLAALATGLCNDAGISLQVKGEKWSYDAWRRVITVSETSLETLGEDWCAGRLVNEVGHYWLTRHDLFRVRFRSFPIARLLLDDLDDGRVNAWMATRYPGSEAWLARVHQTLDAPPPKPLPLVIRFSRECSLEAGRVWMPAPYPIPAIVQLALRQTRDARRRYAEIAPSVRINQIETRDIRKVYIQKVTPRLIRPLFIPTPYESEVRLRALEALELAEDEIFPVADLLLEQDMQAAAEWMAENPRQAQQAQDGEPVQEIPWGQQPVGAEAGPPPAELMRLAQEQLEQFDQPESEEMGTGERLCQDNMHSPFPQRPNNRQRRPGGRGNSPLDLKPLELSDYDQARLRMSPQIDALVDKLERVLRPRQRLGRRSGYPSGSRVDLRRLMSFEADPRGYNKLWMRSSLPERRRVAFSLLVDLSGSMSGEKVKTAFLGTVLMVETLVRMHIPFAVNGFQDDVIPFADFHDPFGTKVRDDLATIPSRASNGNDDGPCLLKVSEVLLDQPVDERFMIVVSDGMPSGSSATPVEDLKHAVSVLTDVAVPLHLIGVGLGPNTEHVSDYYPDSRASVPIDRFADELGSLIAKGLNVE